MSRLSGVSGYLPGTHHPMPTYSHDGGSSVVSEKEKFLIPLSSFKVVFYGLRLLYLTME